MKEEEKYIYERITYGKKDFITSYFAWIDLDEQKEIVNRLENITKDK